MIKFRNNLHPAFFFGGNNEPSGNSRAYYADSLLFGENSDGTKQQTKDAEIKAAAEQANKDTETVKEETQEETTEVHNEVERTYVEGYETEILDWNDISDNQEDMSDRKNRNFLSDDLPEYLWNIRKTPGVLKALSFLPIFSMKENRPSKVDRKAIKYFLKYSSKINLNNEQGKDKAAALMEAFHDNRLRFESTEDTYVKVLENHGITVDKKYLDNIIKAGRFYISTQSEKNSAKDQHAIYLSVLKIIENEGGVDKAVNKFKSIVEQGEKDKKAEKKEGYESGEKLGSTNPELYDIARNLGITDFSSATRLTEKNAVYFWNTPIEKVLGNLNNDRTIDARDTISGGSKTGVQFVEIFNQVGKEKALQNLVEHAKALNKTLNVGLPDVLLDAKTIEGGVKGGHTGLILLLQNIINKPGEDLYTLLSGESPIESDLKIMEEATEASKETLKKMEVETWNKDELVLPTPESMQSGLATAFYTEYKRGIGLGNRISFDQWIKGVAMNTGFQFRNDGTVTVGIGLDYSKKINLGKGWSTTPELSAGAFIPLGMGKIENIAGSAGINDEIAKKWLTKNGVKEHLGVQGGVTLMPTGVVVVSAGFKWERDKAAGIEFAEQEKMSEFRNKIIGSILTKAFEERKGIKSPYATKINFNDNTEPTRVSTFEKAISDVANSKDEKGNILVPEKDQKLVRDAVMRLLVNYNGENLGEEGVKEVIAQKIAEQYAMAWAEDRKAHISKSTYLSGANLGAFWVAGSPLVGIYAGVKWTDHDLDGYGDKWGKEHTINNSERKEEARTSDTLKSLNARLGLAEGQGLNFVENNPDKGIIIPSSLKNRVKVSKTMELKLVKDGEGNVIVSKWTTMGESIRAGVATQSRELLVGEGKESDFVHLDTVPDEWFANKIDDVNTIMLEQSNEGFYTEGNIKNAIEKLKNELKEKYPILETLNPTDEQLTKVKNELDAITDKSKKAKITVERKDGKFDMHATAGEHEGRGLELEYKTKLDMVDTDAKTIADAVYAEALKLMNPTALNAVKHNKSWEKDYAPFRNAMDAGNYENAKIAIVPIFDRLDKEINDENIKFSNILNKPEFQNLKGDALAQAMMAINNIFARSKQVRGGKINYEGKRNYEFKRPNGKSKEMKAIIKERYNILKTLKGKVSDKNAIKRYESLFNATSKYIDKPEFAKTSAKAASLGNTVGFNLGDKTNPENPLFNPEIYDPMVELNQLEGFSKDAREGLHKRAMKMFAENPALVNPVLQTLGIDTKTLTPEQLKQAVENGTMDVTDDNKCQLTLDIGGKKITLSSGMKFGFFTQCVNHTIILSDIAAESNGTNVTFNSGVWNNGRYVEGDKTSIVSTTEVGVSVAAVVHDGRKPTQPDQPPEDDPSSQPGSNITNTPNDVTTDPTERNSETPTTTPTTPETPTTPDYSDFTSNDEDGI